jgi:hypothetical protein
MDITGATMATKNIRSAWEDILEKDISLRLRIQ